MARHHFVTQRRPLDVSSVQSFTDYIRFPFAVPMCVWDWEAMSKRAPDESAEKLRKCAVVVSYYCLKRSDEQISSFQSHWYVNALPDVQLMVTAVGTDIQDEQMTFSGELMDFEGRSKWFTMELRKRWKVCLACFECSFKLSKSTGEQYSKWHSHNQTGKLAHKCAVVPVSRLRRSKSCSAIHSTVVSACKGEALRLSDYKDSLLSLCVAEFRIELNQSIEAN